MILSWSFITYLLIFSHMTYSIYEVLYSLPSGSPWLALPRVIAFIITSCLRLNECEGPH